MKPVNPALAVLGTFVFAACGQAASRATLIIEARNGIGWTARGPILLSNDGGSWGRSGDNIVGYPAAP